MKKYGVNSFFAGIGGFDIGFEKNGFITNFQCEIDSFCNKVLSFHWPSVKKMTDIGSVSAKDIPNADVWCGGFPCQDISVARGASKRLGLQGSRSGLFYQYANLIEQKKPKVVLIENVEGLFNSNGGRDFGVVLQRMTQLGYSVAWRLVNSRYFGVPQSRKRVYLCCWLNDPMKAVRVMFDKNGAHRITNERKDFLSEASEPNSFPKVPKVAYCLAATSGRHTGTDWSRTYVVCKSGVRRMTPLEYERLQGFPDLWTIPENFDISDEEIDTLRYHAIGNAVSIPVVEWIAKRIHLELGSRKIRSSKKDLKNYVPEFSDLDWNIDLLEKTDFSDESIVYKWPIAGIAYAGAYIGGKVNPCPGIEMSSSLWDIVEKIDPDRKYFLTPKAAGGIIRRVDNQKRSLFAPLRSALERESQKVW